MQWGFIRKVGFSVEQVERLSVEEYKNTELFRQLTLEKEQLEAAKEQFKVYRQKKVLELDARALSISDREMTLKMAEFMLQYRVGDKNLCELFLEKEPQFVEAKEKAVVL